ncbi:MAG: queuosine precursor transporter [Phycisphaerales bacterium JB037]
MPSDTLTLPSRQHRYDDLPPLSELQLHIRRERTFLILAGLFLGSLTMLNILGITRFIVLWNTGTQIAGVDLVFAVAVGVLPYPITFLCTDFISELYGRKRANRVVWVGFMLNVWVVLILWFGGILPGFEPTDPGTGEIARDAADRLPVFFEVRALAFGAVAASMIAYLAAQLVDVHVFHFWKKLTNGKHLWLRNNGSTLISQLVDTVAVILITHFYAKALPVKDGYPIWPQLMVFIASGYVFKMLAALLDTIPFYLGAYRLARYLRLPPPDIHEEPALGAAAVEAGVG